MDINHNDQWLFKDPLQDKRMYKKLTGPVLLAREIKEYVTKYNLLVEAENFDETKLKGASYALTPNTDGNAWIYDEDKQDWGRLEIKQDHENNSYYEVPANSFVYIQILQKLRLPYYIIGRFNLKVRYTYKGLLLGTGPQVDPGWNGYLNIPLHNFTTRPVKILINDSFVNIDFVRTSPLDLRKEEIPASREIFLNDSAYIELKKELCPQKPDKLGRKSPSDYVGSEPASSSFGRFLRTFEATKANIENRLNTIKWDKFATTIIMFTVITAALTWLGLIAGAWYFLNSNLLSKIEKLSNVPIERQEQIIDQKIDQKFKELKENLLSREKPKPPKSKGKHHNTGSIE